LLLLLRASVFESGMFEKTKKEYMHVKRGNFLSLFTNHARLLKYFLCIMIGIPTWYVVAILVIQSPEFGKVLHIKGNIDGGAAVMWHYVGLSIGSFVTGLLSQWLRSRKKALFIAFILLLIFTILYFSSYGFSVVAFYFILVLLGIAVGYWAVFVTTASEQFGTNLRATVTTTVPNFVRGATVPITFAVLYLKTKFDLLTAGIIVGAVCIGLALISLYLLEETYHKDLDYNEE